MTLSEAHEIQRKELISLRAENSRLKKQASGTFPSSEKETLERHIRQLEQQCKTKDRRYEDARTFWKSTETRYRDLEMKMVDLEEKIVFLEKENSTLKIRAELSENEVRELNGTNKKLTQKLNVNFENSSLPSSALPFRKKIPNNRKPSGRKPGAQPGHRGLPRKRLLTTSAPAFIQAPQEFLSNPDIYPTGRTITKQFIDIQMNVIVRDYTADEYRNRVTGTRLHGPFPEGIINDVNYGPSLKGFAFLLNNYYNVSICKTKQCISDLTHGIVSLSTGMINHLSAEFSAKTEPERKKIFSLLAHSKAIYSDATVSNVNGTRKAVILCTDKENVLYQHLDHKGHFGLLETPIKNFKGTIIHDHDRSFYQYGSSHQECLAHVLRYLNGAMENEPDVTWHKKMHRLLQQMIHLSKRCKGNIPDSKEISLKENYCKILRLAEDEYSLHPPAKEYMDGFNLQKRLNKYISAHLYFLNHPGIDYTNNVSERCLRKFKRKQKQAVVFRSNSGGQYVCDALSIIETARNQKQNVYSSVIKAFSK